jgi:hypothetical protein
VAKKMDQYYYHGNHRPNAYFYTVYKTNLIVGPLIIVLAVVFLFYLRTDKVKAYLNIRDLQSINA